MSNPLILVADDEPAMRDMVASHLRTLRNPPVEVIVAEDGAAALRLAQEKLPDLVVLDVMMPEMSGWEVCRKIREDVSLAHTSVLMLTGIGENLNQMTSPLYGADAYIDKPFEFDELDAKVREALASRAVARGDIPRPDTNGVAGPAKAAAKKKKAKTKTVKKKPVKKKAAAPKKKKAAPKKKAKTKPKAKAKAKAKKKPTKKKRKR